MLKDIQVLEVIGQYELKKQQYAYRNVEGVWKSWGTVSRMW